MEGCRLNSSTVTKEEKVDDSISHEDQGCTQESSKEDELELAKVKMREVKEENARLKKMLEQIEYDYKSLQKRFINSVREAKNNSNAASTIEEDAEEPEFVSLRLGRSSPSCDQQPRKDDMNNNSSFSKSPREKEEDDAYDSDDDDEKKLKGGLKLGLDYEMGGCKSDPTVEISPENSLDERKVEDGLAGENWPPSKVLKTLRNESDDLSQQSSPKRARVSVRARCDTPTMNDGCQWRKYGQKIAKGNPCPRAYYRCTVAPACPVRKQVQRCAEDMSILITTYEGTHNHQLAVSATAMASTTSAAASMLLSGSSTSQPGTGLTPINNQFANLQGLTTRPFYLPNSSSTFPTITLDLTTGSPFTHFNNILSSNFQSNPNPFSSKNLNFSSSESNIVPTAWGSGYLNNYGRLPYKQPIMGSLNLGGSAQEQLYQSYKEKSSQAVSSQQPLTETLTKAITSDPSFQSVIAAAISSMVSGGGGTQSGGERVGQHLKWGDAVQAISSAPMPLNAKGCASSYLTRTSSSISQAGNLNTPQPTLPFSVSKSSSTAAKSGDQTK